MRIPPDPCHFEGLQFIPLVVEACGAGWALAKELATAVAARSNMRVLGWSASSF